MKILDTSIKYKIDDYLSDDVFNEIFRKYYLIFSNLATPLKATIVHKNRNNDNTIIDTKAIKTPFEYDGIEKKFSIIRYYFIEIINNNINETLNFNFSQNSYIESIECLIEMLTLINTSDKHTIYILKLKSRSIILKNNPDILIKETTPALSKNMSEIFTFLIKNEYLENLISLIKSNCNKDQYEKIDDILLKGNDGMIIYNGKEEFFIKIFNGKISELATKKDVAEYIHTHFCNSKYQSPTIASIMHYLRIDP